MIFTQKKYGSQEVESSSSNWYAYATENGATIKTFNIDNPKVEIYSINGQLLYSKENIKNVENLPLSHGKGVYIIKLTDNGKITTQKIIL